MPFSKREKIILASIIMLILLIPSTALVISFRFRAQTTSQASGNNTNKTLGNITKQSSPSSALDDLKKNLGVDTSTTATDINPSPPISFGPTLSFQVNIEGRKKDQAAKIFVGIANGSLTQNPQYLLSFKVDVPSSGIFTNLSLAGLATGSTYTAYLKGPAQIATSSSFIVKPTVTDLGTLNMLTGDLNEDNVINAQDYAIAKNLYGTTPKSSNWNPNVDFNQDGVINLSDLGFIIKNLNQTGAGGPWYSKTSQLIISPPPAGTPGADLKISTSSGSPSGGAQQSGGYWMWIPGI